RDRDEEVLAGVDVGDVHVLMTLNLTRFGRRAGGEEPQSVVAALPLRVHGAAMEPAVAGRRGEHRDLDVSDLLPKLRPVLLRCLHLWLLSPSGRPRRACIGIAPAG